MRLLTSRPNYKDRHLQQQYKPAECTRKEGPPNGLWYENRNISQVFDRTPSQFVFFFQMNNTLILYAWNYARRSLRIGLTLPLPWKRPIVMIDLKRPSLLGARSHDTRTSIPHQPCTCIRSLLVNVLVLAAFTLLSLRASSELLETIVPQTRNDLIFLLFCCVNIYLNE